MNYISYRSPTCCYRADACPWGIGWYSSKGHVWRCEIPKHLLWRATLNMLEFVASTIGPWIDLVEFNLAPLSCFLSQTDGSTSNEWLRKSNFPDDSEEEEDMHLERKMELARQHSMRLLINEIKEYSQCYPGKYNAVSDSLSQYFHLNVTEQRNLLTSCCPSQLPSSFKIAPLPQEIESCLYVWLEKMPAKTPSRERWTRSGLFPGSDGCFPSNQSNSQQKTISSKTSPFLTEPSYSPIFPKPFVEPIILHGLSDSWLQEQSELPWTTWLRPSGTTYSQVQDSTKTVSLRALYQDSTWATRMQTHPPNNKKRSHHPFSESSIK